MHGNLDLCKLIIEKIGDKNPADKFGWTPLHHAANYCHLDVCKFIVSNVKNKHPMNNEGKPPISYAKNEEIIKLFKC